MSRLSLFLTGAAMLVLLAAATPALASHSFPADVPDGHQFHTEIGIFKDTNITTGCTATAFCPQSPVLRQAMAAFVVRALGLVQRPGETTQKGVPGSRVSMLDDDLSFVGTEGNALRYTGPNGNVLGGGAVNSIAGGVSGGTVAGGAGTDPSFPNRVTATYGTVGGGLNNSAEAFAATVVGGQGNIAAGHNSTVAGGGNNRAGGANSLAAGNNARALYDGAFVWSDTSPFGIFPTPGDYPAGGPDTFSVRATGAGGVTFVTAVQSTTGVATAGTYMAGGASSWTSISDRDAKRDFARVDGASLLRRLAGIPITTWSYKTQPRSVRHIGPMAQDFRRAFRVGESPKGIATIDADGVALAAIQALYRQNQEQAARIDALERTVRRLSTKP